MVLRILADCIVFLHLGFILFALAGSLLVLRWRWIAWVHIPAVAWACAVEVFGWSCPLTPLENAFRAAGGVTGYGNGFVEHYIVPLVYPAGLTRAVQTLLGVGVVAMNGVLYWALIRGRVRAV